MVEPTTVAGAFEFVDNIKTDQFNLRPLNNRAGPIPEDQRKISTEVYGARNILKLLKEQDAFAKDPMAYDEFIARVVQAAEVGCVGSNVDTSLAASALEQIRADIVRRKGRPVTYQYLYLLALCALGGAVVGELINLVARYFLPGLTGYGWVIIGSMVGAWLSAAMRREISFDSIPDFLDYGYEPYIRMLFVGVLAAVFALFLNLQVLSVTLGSADLVQFTENIGVALLLGLIAGISEKALSVQVIERARKILPPAS
jgi:hypothetical protein